jgi:hypothetical protein
VCRIAVVNPQSKSKVLVVALTIDFILSPSSMDESQNKSSIIADARSDQPIVHRFSRCGTTHCASRSPFEVRVRACCFFVRNYRFRPLFSTLTFFLFTALPHRRRHQSIIIVQQVHTPLPSSSSRSIMNDRHNSNSPNHPVLAPIVRLTRSVDNIIVYAKS